MEDLGLFRSTGRPIEMFEFVDVVLPVEEDSLAEVRRLVAEHDGVVGAGRR